MGVGNPIRVLVELLGPIESVRHTEMKGRLSERQLDARDACICCSLDRGLETIAEKLVLVSKQHNLSYPTGG
jgi:hypothetical protein